MGPVQTYRLSVVLGRKNSYRRVLSSLDAIATDPIKHQECCARLFRLWNVNWENGSRAAFKRDIQFLQNVLNKYVRVHGEHERIPEVQDILQRLLEINEQDTNYRVDGRSLKSTLIATEYAELMNRLRDHLSSSRWA